MEDFMRKAIVTILTMIPFAMGAFAHAKAVTGKPFLVEWSRQFSNLFPACSVFIPAPKQADISDQL